MKAWLRALMLHYSTAGWISPGFPTFGTWLEWDLMPLVDHSYVHMHLIRCTKFESINHQHFTKNLHMWWEWKRSRGVSGVWGYWGLCRGFRKDSSPGRIFLINKHYFDTFFMHPGTLFTSKVHVLTTESLYLKNCCSLSRITVNCDAKNIKKI